MMKEMDWYIYRYIVEGKGHDTREGGLEFKYAFQTEEEAIECAKDMFNDGYAVKITKEEVADFQSFMVEQG